MEFIFLMWANLNSIVFASENGGGFFSFLGNITSTLLGYAYMVTNNWGLAIILLTIVIKLLMYPSSKKQAKSMQAMQKLQPEMKKIQEKYTDKQVQQQKLTELYQKHNVNPLTSCLPLLLQMPVLIALYQGIIRTEEMQGASFIWIADLGGTDIPLAIATGVTMYFQTQLQQKWSGAPQTSQTQMMNYIFPAMIVFFGFSLPSGIMLYWFTSNLVMLAQQWFIHKPDNVKEAVRKHG